MSRKSDTPNPVNLKALRGQIDKFDLQLLELLNKRAAIASQIGKVKSEQGGDVFSASREQEVLTNILDANDGPLAEVSLRAIFRVSCVEIPSQRGKKVYTRLRCARFGAIPFRQALH